MLQYALVALGVIGSLYTAYRIAKSNYGTVKSWPAFAPYAALVAVLGSINVYLFILPMTMRM